MVFYWNQAFL
jgi:hypothetical protein